MITEMTIANAGRWRIFENMVRRASRGCVSVSCRFPEAALLFRLVFWFGHDHFRLTKFEFHLLAVANLSDPLENDPVVHIKSLPDDKDVVHFVLDDDLALMHHVIFVDDINVPLVENLESRPLRDDDGVLQHSVDQHGAGLTVTQQASGFGKSARKGMFPVSLLKLASIAPILPSCGNLLPFASTSSICRSSLSSSGRPCIRGSGPRVR